MKVVVSFLLAIALAFSVVLPSYAEPRQVIQGTEIHLTLLTPVSTSISRDGDDFVVAYQPDNVIVFRHNELSALRKVCQSLRWEIVSDTVDLNEFASL